MKIKHDTSEYLKLLSLDEKSDFAVLLQIRVTGGSPLKYHANLQALFLFDSGYFVTWVSNLQALRYRVNASSKNVRARAHSVCGRWGVCCVCINCMEP